MYVCILVKTIFFLLRGFISNEIFIKDFSFENYLSKM